MLATTNHDNDSNTPAPRTPAGWGPFVVCLFPCCFIVVAYIQHYTNVPHYIRPVPRTPAL